MYRRPDYITVVGIVLCLLGAFAVLGALLALAGSDQPGTIGNAPTAAALVGLVGSIATLVSGINILRGQNWARWFYTATVAAFMVYDFLYLFDKLYTLVPATVVRLVVVFLLFLPDANRYFRSSSRRF